MLADFGFAVKARPDRRRFNCFSPVDTDLPAESGFFAKGASKTSPSLYVFPQSEGDSRTS